MYIIIEKTKIVCQYKSEDYPRLLTLCIIVLIFHYSGLGFQGCSFIFCAHCQHGNAFFVDKDRFFLNGSFPMVPTLQRSHFRTL